jgi:hypothetical protein
VTVSNSIYKNIKEKDNNSDQSIHFEAASFDDPKRDRIKRKSGNFTMEYTNILCRDLLNVLLSPIIKKMLNTMT